MATSLEVMYWSYLIGLLLVGLGAYAANWSLGLRKALRVRAYSRQALIVGLFSIYGFCSSSSTSSTFSSRT